MNARINVPPDGIAAFCRRWQITELALFGSALLNDFGADSDVDVLVSFGKGARHTLFDLDDMELELKKSSGARSIWSVGGGLRRVTTNCAGTAS